MGFPAEGLAPVLTNYLLFRLVFRCVSAVRGQRRVTPKTPTVRWHDLRTFYELAAMG